jgi:hypothetical protein
MAIKLAAQYTNAIAASASYPEGSFKNETTANALDGTPLEKAWQDDIQGLLQSLLVAAGISATGSADTVLAPQYLAGIFNLRYYSRVDYKVGTTVTGSNNVKYVALVTNGPGTTIVNPVGGTAGYWRTEQAARYDADNPVGTLRMTNYTPHGFPAGTWVRAMVGRFPVGVDDSDPLWNVPGENGGAKAHNHASGTLGADGHSLTISEMPAHDHTTSFETLGQDRGSSGPALINSQSPAAFTATTSNVGAGSAHSHNVSGATATQDNIPPYESAFFWRRTV